MNVTRKSVLTGKTRTRIISVNPEDLALYESGSISMAEAMPYLNSQDREFIMVGITNREWKNAFSTELAAIINDKFEAM
tara:strand:- start:235 stop:471 length:237 start_codon:yes stop_codon:yes gene_type:complete